MGEWLEFDLFHDSVVDPPTVEAVKVQFLDGKKHKGFFEVSVTFPFFLAPFGARDCRHRKYLSSLKRSQKLSQRFHRRCIIFSRPAPILLGRSARKKQLQNSMPHPRPCPPPLKHSPHTHALHARLPLPPPSTSSPFNPPSSLPPYALPPSPPPSPPPQRSTFPPSTPPRPLPPSLPSSTP